MKILVACEESQAVTIELRRLGHEAYSCDIESCSGGHPEWHIQQDVAALINGKCYFYTTDGVYHNTVSKFRWDMIIAFPPCTHLAVSGARYFKQKIADGRQQQGIDFFMQFANARCDKIAIENPVGIMSSKWRKPDQIIQPFEYGHAESKKNCLWLKGLPRLKPTQIIDKPSDGWNNQNISNGKYTGFKNYDERGRVLAWNNPQTAKLRSKTYPGIAKAMAEQWAGFERV